MFNLYRYFRKGISPGADDTKDSDPGQRDGTAKAYLLFSAFLHVCILLLIGMAFGANVTVREAVESSHDAIDTLRDKVKIELLVPATFLAQWAENVRKTPSQSRRGENRLAFDLLSIHGGAFHSTKKASDKIVQSLDALNNYMSSISKQMFYGITTILILFIIGSFFMYFGDVAPPRAHKTRMAMIILFALPLGAAWGLLAFSTVVGVAGGDFCYSLREFHEIVAGQKTNLGTGSTPPLPPYNMFLFFDLQCPTHTSFQKEFKQVNFFFDNAAAKPTFAFGMVQFDPNKNHTHETWTEAMIWAEKRFSAFGSCVDQTEFGGNLAYHMCGDHNASAVSAMALMWLASAGLSMLFGVLVFIFSLGQPPSEFATGYEMLQLFGAPKLIRAFGDVGNALTRQATFHRMASSIDRNSMDGREQAKLHVTKSVAEAFTDCAIQVEDKYLVHIQSSRKSGRFFNSNPSSPRHMDGAPDPDAEPDIEQPESPSPDRRSEQ